MYQKTWNISVIYLIIKGNRKDLQKRCLPKYEYTVFDMNISLWVVLKNNGNLWISRNVVIWLTQLFFIGLVHLCSKFLTLAAILDAYSAYNYWKCYTWFHTMNVEKMDQRIKVNFLYKNGKVQLCFEIVERCFWPVCSEWN